MNDNKGAKRWLREEIEFGMEAARFVGVDPGLYEEWDRDDQEDELDEPEQAEGDEEAERERERIAQRRAELVQQMRRTVPEGAVFSTIVPGSIGEDLASLIRAAETVINTIETCAPDQLEGQVGEIDRIERGIEDVRQEVEARTGIRDDILEKLKGLTADEDADELEISGLSTAKEAVSRPLEATPLRPEVLEKAQKDLGQAEQAMQAVVEAAGKRRKLAAEMAQKCSELVAGKAAEEEEAQALALAVQKVTDALKAKPLVQGVLDKAQELFLAAGEKLQEIQKAIDARAKTHKEIRTAGEQIADVGYLPDQLTDMQAAREILAEALKEPITTKRNEAAQQALEELRKVADRISRELADLGDAEGIKSLCENAGIQEKDFAALEKALGNRDGLAAHLKVFPPKELGQLCKSLGGAAQLGALLTAFGDAASLKKAMTGLGGADKLVALAKDGPLDGAGIKKLCTDLGTGFAAGLLSGGVKAAEVVALHKAFGNDASALTKLAKDAGLAAKPAAMVALFTRGCGGKPEKFKEMCDGFSKEEDRTRLKGLIEDGGLGDAPAALGEMFATGCGADPKALIQLTKSMSDAEAKKSLKRLLTDGGLAGEAGELKEGHVDPKCLGMIFMHGAGPAPKGSKDDAEVKRRADSMAAMLKGLDQNACKKLKTMLTDGGMGRAPETFGHALGIGCGGKADQVKAFTTAFSGANEVKALKQALEDGGLKGQEAKQGQAKIDPRCFGELLKNGAGEPLPAAAKRMTSTATLLKGLAKADCQKLNAMLTEGGFGDAPETLGHMIGTGCKGKAEDLKTFQNALDKDGRAGLKTLLDNGGLKAEVDEDTGEQAVDPRCLAQLLKHGGVNVAETPDGKLDATSAGNLNKLFKGMKADGAVATNLGKTMKEGKLGREPEVFAKLVGTGCKKGDPVKLGNLVKELGAGENNKKLGSMLQDGGFGLTDKDGKAIKNPPKTECLAYLFDPGSDGDPAELTRMLKKLDANKLKNMKGVMTTGSLGQYPKVLGNMYKHGCLANPNGGAANGTGEKNPDVLFDALNGFNTEDKQKQFKDMMDPAKGGFGKSGKEGRLASVLRYGLTPKGANKKQDGAKLQKLCEAFKGNKMADLGTTMDAIETAPAWMLEASKQNEPNQPGKGLQNLLASTKHKDKVDGLHTNFFAKLKQRDTAAPAGGGNPPNLGLAKLIQNAASFEHETVTQSNVSLNANTQLDLGHVATRHTRMYNDLAGNATDPNAPTTLYPRTFKGSKMDEAKLKGHVTATLTGCTGTKRSGGNYVPNQGKGNPPTSHADLNDPSTGEYRGPNFVVTGTFTKYNNAQSGNEQSRVGFNRGTGNSVKITQFFPQAGDNHVSVNADDMRAMKSVLK
ncbi:hypothetical protein [Seohaeicola zhoushanensis]|uniref:Uncharacterized protein n=1 Tax=Seohaeicola zhoushanensis TaxID=1569283 RepID=A0A8J3M602_9RHOB|nr:hypothetical protein [Seohaeicola zhoushanensis]GHF45180.1 hypothetical protein GCM10017056_15970 [Seohaeicola zhoushanensis]